MAPPDGMVDYSPPKPGAPSSFMPLGGIQTNAATSSVISIENIKRNVKLGYTKIEDLPEYMKVKGIENPIALVGGGPSLKNHLDELREFKTIIACGSVHDYLMENGIVPTYATICDPDPISINYFTKLHKETTYLFATSVDQKVLEHVKGYKVVLWHCHSHDYKDIDFGEGRQYNGIGGGCTVGLRSLSIAVMFGYQNIHLFGFDSCMGESDNHHAYGLSDENEREGLGHIFRVKLGDPVNGKTYSCAGYQLAQVENYKQFWQAYGMFFKPTFHGEGLLAATHKAMTSANVIIETESKQ